jgi:hypothetical protein
MANLTADERSELEALRQYKLENDGKALTRSFVRLEQLMESAQDPSISLRAFKTIADCLLALRDELYEQR